MVTKTDNANLIDYLRSENKDTVLIEDLPIRYDADEALKINNRDDTLVDYYYLFGNRVVNLKKWEVGNSSTSSPIPDYSQILIESRIYETFEFDKNKLPNL